MNLSKRPLSVTVLGWLYLAVGVIGFVYHSYDSVTSRSFHYDSVLVISVELIAIVCGAFLLRGHNWARWLAVAWMAFHVGVSAFETVGKAAVHVVFLVLIAWGLFHAKANAYFRGQEEKPS